MKRRIALCGLVLAAATCPAYAADDSATLKSTARASIEEQRASLVTMSDAVWEFAETALHETKSSALLADYAEQQGFQVERGVAGMPTAFIASYGEGRPVIGVLGEYDALPRLSQTATTSISPLVVGGAGHGCGHNLYGVAGLGAASAIRELIDDGRISGTVRFYGTPAEESIGGKTYMAREGLFDDVDVVVSWHPASETAVDVSGSQAMVETTVEFFGVSSHAAADPWNGRSALDGLELFTHAMNLLREHVHPTVRIHYSIVDGGGAPNVVPATASAAVWIRDSEIDSVLQLYERMKVIAQGAATAAGVESKVTLIAGTYNMLNNKEAAKIAHANMLELGEITYSDDEIEFAQELQRAMGVPDIGMNGAVTPLDLDDTEISGGSTDVADVSWVVPTIDVNVVTAPADIPWHSWGVVSVSGTSIAHRGMTYAADVLAMTMVDLFTSPAALDAVQAEFREDTKDFTYKAYLPDGPPPIPAAE